MLGASGSTIGSALQNSQKNTSEQDGQNQNKDCRYIGDIIHDNFYDQLVLIGFPYDQGAKNAQFRQGSFLGPDCFRRFIKSAKFGVLKNVEINLDIQKYLNAISDYGNI